jgi:hypothetical protein
MIRGAASLGHAPTAAPVSFDGGPSLPDQRPVGVSRPLCLTGGAGVDSQKFPGAAPTAAGGRQAGRATHD